MLSTRGWVRGTRVASRIADGAPFVRLYNASDFLGWNQPDPLIRTEEGGSGF